MSIQELEVQRDSGIGDANDRSIEIAGFEKELRDACSRGGFNKGGVRTTTRSSCDCIHDVPQRFIAVHAHSFLKEAECDHIRPSID